MVDLSDRLTGAFTARLFADFGADVMLAKPLAGHPLRHEPPFHEHGDEPVAFPHAYANNGAAHHRAGDGSGTRLGLPGFGHHLLDGGLGPLRLQLGSMSGG